MWKKRGFWWVVAISWCIIIAFATQNPFFRGNSTEQLLNNPFFDSFILNIILRKTGHVVAFGLLAIFFALALRGKRFYPLAAWALASAYGAVDEWHQSLVPGRDGRFSDVMIDSFGAFLGALFIYLVIKGSDPKLRRRKAGRHD